MVGLQIVSHLYIQGLGQVHTSSHRGETLLFPVLPRRVLVKSFPEWKSIDIIFQKQAEESKKNHE